MIDMTKPPRRQTVGIVGVSPVATLDLMDRVRLSSSLDGQPVGVRMLVDCNPLTPDPDDAILRDGPSPALLLSTMAQGLQGAGAGFVVMAGSTAHAFQFEVERALDIPFVSLIEEAADAAALAAKTHGPVVGLLASDGCLAAGLYQQELARRGLACRLPDEPQQARLMALLHEARTGGAADIARRMAAIARDLRSTGADLILATCAEIPVSSHPTDMPLIIAADALAAAIADYALGRRDLPMAFSSTTVGPA